MAELFFIVPFALLLGALFLAASGLSLGLLAEQPDDMSGRTTGTVESVEAHPLLLPDGEPQVVMSYGVSFAGGEENAPATRTVWCPQLLAGAWHVGDEVGVAYREGNPDACALAPVAEAAAESSAVLVRWAAWAGAAGIVTLAIAAIVGLPAA